MTSPPSPLRALRSRLGRLRRRIRALFVVQGLARWIVAVVVALGLFFVADRLLDLPLGVRRFIRLGLLDQPGGLAVVSWIVLVAAAAIFVIFSTRRRLGAAPVVAFALGGIVGVLAWLTVRLFRPAGIALPDNDLALTVEHRFRRLNDRLAAALDFERELAHPTRGESEAMMRVVLEEATEEARGLAFVRAVSVRKALPWIGGALGAVALAVGLVFAAPDTIELWARRSLLLEDAHWPRATTILAIDLGPDGQVEEHDPAVPYDVAIGRPLLVYAMARGRVPDEVVLLDHMEGARPLPRRMFPVPDMESIFQIEIRDVRHPFAFVLHGGDDADDQPVYHVRITVPPRVLHLSARLVYPAYLDRTPEEVEGGNLFVPEGTEVTVSLETDVPVAEAKALVREMILPAAPTVDDGRHFAFSLTAKQTARYRILLRTASGRESDPAADTYEIRVAPDRGPRVQWIHPCAGVETTPVGRVPLLLLATDDHAVSDLVLEVRFENGPIRRLPLGARVADETGTEDGHAEDLAVNDGPYGRPEVRTYVPLEVRAIEDEHGRAPTAPARLAVRVVGRDSKGQTKESPWTPIDVYSAVDMERTLAARRTSVRAEIVAVLAEQLSRRDQLAGLLGVEIGEVERDLLESIQFAQAKITQDTDRAVMGFLEILNSWLYGRFGAEIPTEKILGFFDRHHRRTYGADDEAQDDEGQDDEGRDDETRPGDPVFPYALYDEIVDARRRRVIFDTGLLDRMLVVLADAVDAAARRAGAAYRAAAQAVVHEGDVETTLAAQDALITALEHMLDSMQSWQSLNDVILRLRRIIEEQEALNDRLEGPPSPEEAPEEASDEAPEEAPDD